MLESDFKMGMIFFVLFIGINLFACCQTKEIPPGQISDSIKCTNCPEFNYALYLPVSYSDTTEWPVIFIFDPGANGMEALTNFVKAAEKFGYILAASNNSKNGLSVEHLRVIIDCLITDVIKKISVDNKRVYTSGFSGGSRVASLTAIRNGNITGVIGCGAGFPSGIENLTLSGFDYYGLVGDNDMNYLEMEMLKRVLNDTKIASEFNVFKGDHEWPSADLLSEAVEWHEIMAMKKGLKPIDLDFIDSYIEKKKRLAAYFLKTGKLIEASECYRSLEIISFETIQRQFFTNKADSLEQSKDYLKAFKKLKDQHDKEIEMERTYISKLNDVARMKVMPDSIKTWWKTNIASLIKSKSDQDTSQKNLAARVLNFLSVSSYESGKKFLEYNQYKTAALYFEISSMTQPENSIIYYILARTYALDKDFDKSLKYLEKAIEKGYNNITTFEDKTLFGPLFENKKFIQLKNRLNSTRP